MDTSNLAAAYDVAMFGTEHPKVIHTSQDGMIAVVNKMTDISDDRRKELLDFANACPAGCWIELTADEFRYVSEDD